MATGELIDVEDEGRVLIDNGAMVAAISRAEIDCQITTAKQYPRSITVFKRQAMEMATIDEETAESMFYTLPRAGKKIQGPSIRMAEVVGACYGNLRYGARIVSTDSSFITAQGACHDLEKNIAISYEIRRRITDKTGKRFNDDMIQTTGNAAMSIALREAIFRVVPRSLFNSIYEAAKTTAIGKAKTMSEQRHGAFDWFKKAGATEPQLLAFLERKGIDDVTTEDIVTLRGLVTSIKEGDITIEDALMPKVAEHSQDKADSLKQLDDLAEKMKQKAAAETKARREPHQSQQTVVPGPTEPKTVASTPTATVSPPVAVATPPAGVSLQDIIMVELRACRTEEDCNECYQRHMGKGDADWLQDKVLGRIAALSAPPELTAASDRMAMLQEKIQSYRQAGRLQTLLSDARSDKTFSPEQVSTIELWVKDRMSKLTATLPGM